MADTTYQIILSTDGKHTVIATTDDRLEAKNAMAWVSTVYDQVVQRYGLKHEQYTKNGEPREENGGDAVPVCGVHHRPMERVNGKKGPFWSCHERNEDGSWCNFKAEVK
jgi:hypothetical protein